MDICVCVCVYVGVWLERHILCTDLIIRNKGVHNSRYVDLDFHAVEVPIYIHQLQIVMLLSPLSLLYCHM